MKTTKPEPKTTKLSLNDVRRVKGAIVVKTDIKAGFIKWTP